MNVEDFKEDNNGESLFGMDIQSCERFDSIEIVGMMSNCLFQERQLRKMCIMFPFRLMKLHNSFEVCKLIAIQLSVIYLPFRGQIIVN